MNFCRGSDTDIREYRHKKKGADSLMGTARRAVVANRRGLDVDILKNVPWNPVGMGIWREIVRRYV
jgi:hypothetical protein